MHSYPLRWGLAPVFTTVFLLSCTTSSEENLEPVELPVSSDQLGADAAPVLDSDDADALEKLTKDIIDTEPDWAPKVDTTQEAGEPESGETVVSPAEEKPSRDDEQAAVHSLLDDPFNGRAGTMVAAADVTQEPDHQSASESEEALLSAPGSDIVRSASLQMEETLVAAVDATQASELVAAPAEVSPPAQAFVVANSSATAPALLAALEEACTANDGASCNRLGFYLDRQGQLDLARVSFQKACGLGTLKGCNNLGWLAERQGQRGAAMDHYRDACQGRHPGACENLARIDGVKSRDQGTVAAVQESIKESVKPSPKAEVQMAATSRSMVEKVLEEACLGDQVKGCVRLATTLSKAGDVASATRLYQHACEQGDGIACYNAARGARQIGNSEQALNLYEKALRLALVSTASKG